MHKLLIAGVFILCMGCAAFERPDPNIPSPFEQGWMAAVESFKTNAGSGTPAEVLYAAISALAAGGIAGTAAYKKGKKVGANGKTTNGTESP